MTIECELFSRYEIDEKALTKYGFKNENGTSVFRKTLSEYIPTLKKEIASYGLNMEIAEKEKTKESAIRSAFLKGNTNPPAGAMFEHKYQLLPAPYEVTLYDMPSLFAGKVHAVICRAWKSRVKGRNLYDYVFYLSIGASLNTEHMKARLVQSNVLKNDDPFTIDDANKLLVSRFETIDYEQAKEDVSPFIKDKAALDLWSADFFIQITDGLKSY